LIFEIEVEEEEEERQCRKEEVEEGVRG